MNKKKTALLSTVIGVLAIGATAVIAPISMKVQQTWATNYVLQFNEDTNSCMDIANAQGVAYTTNGNEIKVTQSALSDVLPVEGGAFTLKAGGFIANETAITGVTSVTVDTANGETIAAELGYGATTPTWVETVAFADEATFNFNNTQPSFVRFKNNTEEDIDIISITVNYNCAPQANIWEVKGSFNSWGEGLKMYYNYSYEKIDTEDQWMLKGVSFEKNAQFKFHKPDGDVWVGVNNATIGDSEGSAKAAGQISGSDNIMVKTAITTDLYLKISRDTTPTYNIWVAEDPNAEPVEEVNAYTFSVTGSAAALGSWSMGSGPKFTLDEEKSTSSKLQYSITIKLNVNDEFKITCHESGQWIGHNWGRHQSTTNITNAGENFKVKTAGTYVIHLKDVSPKFGEGDGHWDLAIVFELQA